MIGTNAGLAKFDGSQFMSESSDFAKDSKWVEDRVKDNELHTAPGTRVLIVANGVLISCVKASNKEISLLLELDFW